MSNRTGPQTSKLQEMNNFQLKKNSDASQIKQYFTEVLKLKQTGEEFPVDLELVWPLVYSEKRKAINVLKKEYIEGEDFYLEQMGEVVKINKLKNGVKIDAKLSVSCMEYFIAKKVRPVFEVYRQVFHKSVLDNGALFWILKAMKRKEKKIIGRRLFENFHLTQKKTAEVLGVAEKTVSHWKNSNNWEHLNTGEFVPNILNVVEKIELPEEIGDTILDISNKAARKLIAKQLKIFINELNGKGGIL